MQFPEFQDFKLQAIKQTQPNKIVKLFDSQHKIVQLYEFHCQATKLDKWGTSKNYQPERTKVRKHYLTILIYIILLLFKKLMQC